MLLTRNGKQLNLSQSLFTNPKSIDRSTTTNKVNGNNLSRRQSFQPIQMQYSKVATMHPQRESVIETHHMFFDIERFPDGSFKFLQKDYSRTVNPIHAQKVTPASQMVVKQAKVNVEDVNVQKNILKNSVLKEVNLKQKKPRKASTPKDEKKEAVFEIKGDKTLLQVNNIFMDETVLEADEADKDAGKEGKNPEITVVTNEKKIVIEKSKSPRSPKRSGKVVAMATAEATLAPEKSGAKDHSQTESDHAKTVEKLQTIFDGFDFEEEMNGDSQVVESKDYGKWYPGGENLNYDFYWKGIEVTKNDDVDCTGPSDGSQIHFAISDNFGSIDQFKSKFEQIGSSTKGHAWLWLVLNQETQALEITQTGKQDGPNPDTHVPLLNIDIWDQQTNKAALTQDKLDFIRHFWSVVNWDLIDQRYQAAMQSGSKSPSML